MTAFSFEFFPPKSEKGFEDLLETAQLLSEKGPAFMTVTFGAGGSTRDGPFETVTRLAENTDVPMAAHLTQMGMTKVELKEYSARL